MMRTLCLQAPSFDGFDGGAGARYQARREIRSFWYPTWLAQVAAVVPGSKLIDATPHGLTLKDVIAKHPKTPWADLAQDTIDRGFSVKFNEWHHHPSYGERQKFVPKY